MSTSYHLTTVLLGDVASEDTERLGTASAECPVYGVDRTVGLTPAAKYVAADLSRYKRLSPGMFAYNPMRLNIGSIGFCSNKHISGVVSPDYVVFRCDTTRLDPEFLHYYIRSPSWANWTRGSGVGSVRMRIYFRELARMQISLPPLTEQHAIAHILGTLDDKIDLNRRMNETLEAMARALFKSWFVDFGPVRAKAEGHDTGLPPHIAALFPDSFDDSELGEIPKGWLVEPIGQVTTCVGGSTPSTKEPSYWDGDIPFATPRDLASLSSPVLLQTERKITERGSSRISSGVLPVGTVLLSSRAPIGYLAISEIPVCINQGFIAIICDKQLPNLYVLHWARNNADVIVGQANGTTFLEISKGAFRPISILVPPPTLLDGLIHALEPLHRRIVSNLIESETLAALRDALLPKLMSGEIRINDAERSVEVAS